jgi:hypothetical protein
MIVARHPAVAGFPGLSAGKDPSRRDLSDLSDFVPEGLYDRSQAIYCLEPVQSRIRPVGTV